MSRSDWIELAYLVTLVTFIVGPQAAVVAGDRALGEPHRCGRA